jgi:Sulfatase/short chain dehydrogenase
MKLLGKVVLVTGGSQGIGRGVALRLARDGADIVVAYRSHPEEAKETSAEIETYGRRVVAFKADLSNRTEIDRLVSADPICFLLGALFVTSLFGQDILPRPLPEFNGKIEPRASDSKPDFPKPLAAPKGAPNILIVLLDDVGFGASSTFGGPISTPTLDSLAQDGLRYNKFHTTAMCSPTRAALLTGHNHHSVHTGQIMEMATGFPGYDSLLGKDTATIGELLRQNGWNTAWFGKDHNVPDWETSQAGPFDHWPTGLGFEKFYGFIGGDMNQWRATVFDGTKAIEPYVGHPDYNLDYDLADQAIQYINEQHALAPEKPFFLYYAPGATHAPHPSTQRMGREIQREVRSRLGRGASRDVGSAEKAWHRAAGHGADRAIPRNSALGFSEWRPKETVCPHDGNLRRLFRADGFQCRPRYRGDRYARSEGEHHCDLHLRRQRGKCRGPT